MAALAGGPLKPLVSLVVDCRTLKPPGINEPAFGVNFSPAAPWATLMKLPLVICVVPLFW